MADAPVSKPMITTVTTSSVYTAMVTWEGIMAAIAANPDFTSTRPTLTTGMTMGGMGSGLSFTWSMTPQQVDQVLRASISDLPTLGLYTVTVLSGDPVNALSVTWTGPAPPAAAV